MGHRVAPVGIPITACIPLLRLSFHLITHLVLEFTLASTCISRPDGWTPLPSPLCFQVGKNVVIYQQRPRVATAFSLLDTSMEICTNMEQASLLVQCIEGDTWQDDLV